MRGEDADLACLYDLRGKDMYSFKWYKDGDEFYRFEPAIRHRKKAFTQPGIQVDLAASNETHVRLKETTLQATGRYMCQITMEAPTFTTIQGEGEMHVIDSTENTGCLMCQEIANWLILAPTVILILAR